VITPGQVVARIRTSLEREAHWVGDDTIAGRPAVIALTAPPGRAAGGTTSILVLAEIGAGPGLAGELDAFRADALAFSRDRQARLKVVPGVTVGGGVSVMPVAVTAGADGPALDWATSKRGAGMGNMVYPVLVDTASGTITHRKRVLYGALNVKPFRRVITRDIIPALTEDPG
jgi:hypothetical protein